MRRKAVEHLVLRELVRMILAGVHWQRYVRDPEHPLAAQVARALLLPDAGTRRLTPPRASRCPSSEAIRSELREPQPQRSRPTATRVKALTPPRYGLSFRRGPCSITLGTRAVHDCARCGGLVGDAFRYCLWCAGRGGKARRVLPHAAYRGHGGGAWVSRSSTTTSTSATSASASWLTTASRPPSRSRTTRPTALLGSCSTRPRPGGALCATSSTGSPRSALMFTLGDQVPSATVWMAPREPQRSLISSRTRRPSFSSSSSPGRRPERRARAPA